MLLDAGAEAGRVTSEGVTPLHVACTHGHAKVAHRVAIKRASGDHRMSIECGRRGFI